MRRAAALRHQLADIAALPVPQARSQAMWLRLLPSERLRWAPALRLALAVLNDWSPLAEQEHNRDDAFDVSIRTDRLWETLIAEALETAKPRVKVTIGHRRGVAADLLKKKRKWLQVTQPWELSGAPFASDLIAEFVETPATKPWRYVIVDAKYLRIPVGTVPFKPEQRKYVPVEQTRQVFAYGALWRDKDKNGKCRDSTVDVALVYLGRGAEEPEQSPQDDVTKKPHLLQLDQENCQKKRFDGLTLYVLEMPFPAVSDCASRSALNAWLASKSGGASAGNALGRKT